MNTMPPEIVQAVEASAGQPVRLTNPNTNTEYVLIRAEVFDRVKELFYDDSEFDPREAYPLVDRVMAEDDANDPTLESYQQYKR
jgi:hypothetical protein